MDDHQSHSHPDAMSPSAEDAVPVPSFQRQNRGDHHTLKYDYHFQVDDKSTVEAITVNWGATHPMLNGSSHFSVVLESIYAHGGLSSPPSAVLRLPGKKRDILKYLPVVDFRGGIGNAFIPRWSGSFTDDGITRCYPHMENGRMTVAVQGGIVDPAPVAPEGGDSAGTGGGGKRRGVVPGIRVRADFGALFDVRSEASVAEFPEFDIFEADKLYAMSSGSFAGACKMHLKLPEPAPFHSGPHQPLEKLYHLDFSSSNLSLTLEHLAATLSHRRLTFPSGTTYSANVIDSVVDLSL